MAVSFSDRDNEAFASLAAAATRACEEVGVGRSNDVALVRKATVMAFGAGLLLARGQSKDAMKLFGLLTKVVEEEAAGIEEDQEQDDATEEFLRMRGRWRAREEEESRRPGG